MARVMRANGTIRVARFVKIDPSDNNSVLEADANEGIIGISQIGGRTAPLPVVTTDPPEAAQSGENVHIHTLNTQREDIVLRIGSGGCTAGGRLKSDADGNGVAVATTGTTIQHVGAIAEETASEGDYAKVTLCRYEFRPALS